MLVLSNIIRWTRPNPAYIATTGTIYNNWRLVYSRIPLLGWRATPAIPPTATVFRDWHLLYNSKPHTKWKSGLLPLRCEFDGQFSSFLTYQLIGKCEYDGQFTSILSGNYINLLSYSGQFSSTLIFSGGIFAGTLEFDGLFNGLIDGVSSSSGPCEYDGQFNGIIAVPAFGVREGCIVGTGNYPGPGSSSSNVLVF